MAKDNTTFQSPQKLVMTQLAIKKGLLEVLDKVSTQINSEIGDIKAAAALARDQAVVAEAEKELQTFRQNYLDRARTDYQTQISSLEKELAKYQ